MENNRVESFDVLILKLNDQNKESFRTNFFKLHAYDQGLLFSQLNPDERQLLYKVLQPTELADVFDEMDDEPEQLAKYLDEMKPQYAAEMLNEMFADNEADVLGVLQKEKLNRLLRYMSPVEAANVRQMLRYDERSAGGLMTTEFISIPADISIKSALNQVKQEALTAETISYIYVIDEDNHLIGVISVKDLLINTDDIQIDSIMNRNVISVGVNEDRATIADQVRDYNFIAIPVTNDQKQILGIITVDDVIDVIDEESAEDYSRLAGVNSEESYDNPLQAVINRMPWLITLLLLGLLSAALIDQYQVVLEKTGILAIFISLITGMAGNAGTQSLAVAIQKITNDDEPQRLSKIIRNELLTGLFIGIITGLVIFVIVLFWQHSVQLGLIVGTALSLAIFVADLAGSLIPIGMKKIGVDPAVASGPFISTLSDLTSILIYFSIASSLLH